VPTNRKQAAVTSDIDQLRVQIEADGPADGPVVIHLDGELDPHTAPALQGALDEVTRNGASEVVLDLAELRFIDSSGLRVVISAHRTLSDAGGRLVLRSPSETASRLLEITGLTGHLTIEDDAR
jgi:anti-anti-sigma factor